MVSASPDYKTGSVMYEKKLLYLMGIDIPAIDVDSRVQISTTPDWYIPVKYRPLIKIFLYLQQNSNLSSVDILVIMKQFHDTFMEIIENIKNNIKDDILLFLVNDQYFRLHANTDNQIILESTNYVLDLKLNIKIPLKEVADFEPKAATSFHLTNILKDEDKHERRRKTTQSKTCSTRPE